MLQGCQENVIYKPHSTVIYGDLAPGLWDWVGEREDRFELRHLHIYWHLSADLTLATSSGVTSLPAPLPRSTGAGRTLPEPPP